MTFFSAILNKSLKNNTLSSKREVGEAQESFEGGEKPEALPSPRDSSLLVYSSYKSPFSEQKSSKILEGGWDRKQRRLYHRVMSGFELAKRMNDYTRVITLTSSVESPEDIHRSFEILKKRIRRKYKKFEYSTVKELTKSGLVHLHIVYRGSFISQKWLSEAWEDIHKAKIVWIAKLYSWKLAKHLARYFVKEGIGRFWSSWKWVYRGFVRDWKILVHQKGFNALKYWKSWLFNYYKENNTKQVTLLEFSQI